MGAARKVPACRPHPIHAYIGAAHQTTKIKRKAKDKNHLVVSQNPVPSERLVGKYGGAIMKLGVDYGLILIKYNINIKTYKGFPFPH